MKKFLSLLFALGIVSGALFAEQIDEASVLKNVRDFTTKSRLKSFTEATNLKMAYKSQEGSEIYFYAFANGIDGGYVIASADDGTEPILGYSDCGTFDYANIPENMKVWLESYVDQIKYARSHGLTFTKDAITKTASSVVEPLLKNTKWGQESPFNDQCPLIGTERTVTGCVATATSQIMYYFKYPTKGVGTKSYSWNNQTLTADFGNTTYNWEKMATLYLSTTPTVSKEAVATLMYHAGVGASMTYGLSNNGGSSAMTEDALYGLREYFNYDWGIQYIKRNYYDSKTWIALMKNELDNGRPIMYGGYYQKNGGHQFVCDGYNSQDMFHMNWGWSGSSDGYFKISILNTDAQSTDNSIAGFNYGQDALIGIQKKIASSTVKPLTVYAEGITPSRTSGIVGQDLTSDKITFQIAKMTNSSADGSKDKNFYIALFQNGEEKAACSSKTNVIGLRKGEYYTDPFFVDGYIPTGVADGVYDLKIMYDADAASTNQHFQEMRLPYNVLPYKVTISGSNYTLTQEAAPALAVTNLKVGSAYSNTTFNVSCDVTNTGREYYGAFNVKILEKVNNSVVYTGNDVVDAVPQGATVSLSFMELTTLAAGDYLITIADNNGANLCTPQALTILSTPATASLKVNSITFDDPKKVQKDNFKVTINVTNSGGYYNNKLSAVIFKKSEIMSSASIYKTDEIKAGETKDIIFTGSLSLVPGTYYLSMYDYITGDWKQTNGVNNSKDFTLVTPTSVEGVESNKIIIYPNPVGSVVNIETEGAIQQVQIFDMTGKMLINSTSSDSQIDVSHLSTGSYIMHVIVDGISNRIQLIKK